LLIEEIVSKVSKAARQQNSKITLKIVLDVCGSAGQYYRLLNQLEKSEDLATELLEVIMFCPCDWNEKSMGNAQGGKLTYFLS